MFEFLYLLFYTSSMQSRLEKVKQQRLEKKKKLEELGIPVYPTSITLTGERITTEQAKNALGEEVLIAGRIMSLRSHGSILFANLKDFSGLIQVFFQKKFWENGILNFCFLILVISLQ